jgi:hypothetical protein
MTRRRIEIPDSLELLLDTICNTFGAVIFISMLLSLLAGKKGGASDADMTSELIEQMTTQLERDVAVSRARHTQLQRQVSQQSELLKQFSSPASLQMAGEIMQATENTMRMLDSRSTQLEILKEHETESLKKEQELMHQLDAREKLQREKEAITRELEAATERLGRKAKISRIRPTSKLGFAFMLHNNRLYRTLTPDGDLDETDCIELDRDGLQIISPRPTGGLDLEKGEGRIGLRFDQLDSGKHFVRLFVSPNSFAQFIVVKDALIDRGLEYEVIVFENNEAQLFLSSEPINSFVQ